MNKPIPMEEQETTINLFPSRVSKKALIYSCVPLTMKKIRGMAESRPDSARITEDHGDWLYAEVDASCVKIKPKRVMSEAQRQAAADRLAEGRKKVDA